MEETIDLAPAIAMIRGRMSQIDPELSLLEARANELRRERTKLTTALRAIDPSYVSNGKPKKKTAAAAHVSETLINEVEAYLREHAEELNQAGFTVTGLNETTSFSKSTLGRALPELHERDVLHVVRRTAGGGKVYKVIA